MSIALPRYPVTAPPLEAAPYGLVTSANDGLANGDETNGDWVRGFAYRPEDDVAAGVALPYITTYNVPISGFGKPGSTEWQPYVSWVPVYCSPFGFQAFDWGGRAQRLLNVASKKQIEAEFWGGALARQADLPNLYLAMPTRSAAASGATGQGFGPVDLTPFANSGVGGPSIKRAFQMLEQAIADSGAGARGMIHARPEASPNFLGVKPQGDRLVTQNGSIVVPGNGYPNLGPGAIPAPAGKTWIYATGMVEVRVDTSGASGVPDGIRMFPDPRPESPEYDPGWTVHALDKSVNQLVVRAERLNLASWDGSVHFAILANLDT